MTNRHEGEEPAATTRAAARDIRGMFVALVQEGFNDYQALVIVGQVLQGALQRPPSD